MNELRAQIHAMVDRLPETALHDALDLLTLFADEDEEIETLWLLLSGHLKHLVDAIEAAPPPSDDWRKHLYDL